MGDQDTMTIITKNQGWMTVNKDMNRRKPIEKMAVSENSTKTSMLTPSWMQSNYPRNTTDNMIRAAPNNVTVRTEKNRLFLCDKN